QSGLDLFDAVEPAGFPQTALRHRNARAANSVGLDPLTDDAWIAHFGRFTPLPDNQPQPLALRYHGHQFRVYNPDLGDGRGFLFAQLADDGGRLLDLGTKGSGTTPYSRGGDGRLTLKGGVREVLATAMLEALGVPTSKSFSLIETGEALYRGDEPSPTRSSVLVRLSHSHIRFGTFERLAYTNDTDTMEALIAFIIANYYPLANDAAGVFDAIASACARLAARWMTAGFVHGVLNTDNMNITGESFDYGPYRFLPRYDTAFTAAYFDRSGLYAYGRQPATVHWNLGILAQCLSLICPSEPLVATLNAFAGRYRSQLHSAVCERLNIDPGEGDAALTDSLFAFLDTLTFDGSFEAVFYDWFGGIMSEPRARSGPRAHYYKGAAFDAFYDQLRGRSPAGILKLDHPRLTLADPETLLIDEIEAIWSRIADADDWSGFEAKLQAIEIYREALGLTTEA
ncbi:MAG: protein adenylyltransferase SelO, partial [Asticcacaulis sp.]